MRQPPQAPPATSNEVGKRVRPQVVERNHRTIASKVVDVTGGTREKQNRGLVIDIQIFETPKT